MKRFFRFLPFILATLFVTENIAYAHHSFSMFNRKEEKVISGTVVRWAFNNPHSWLYMNVTNDDGSETLWSFEASSPVRLVAIGILGSSFEPGDKLTVMYCPLKDGRPGGGLGWVMLEDGNFVDASDGGCDGSEENIARWKEWLKQGVTSRSKE